MTYREHVDKLLRECERKADAYIHVVGEGGQSTTYVANVKREWQKVEVQYHHYLNLIKSQRVKPDDLMPEPISV